MPVFYFGTEANKIGEATIDDKTGQLVKVTMYPVAPNPDHLKPGSPVGVATEWVVQHPTQPRIIMALTSYGNTRAAHLTCFRAGSSGLTKTTMECNTAGRQACHAMFYHPKSRNSSTQVTLAVAHHNDAMVTFFQFPTSQTEKMPSTLEDQPVLTMELPEMVPGTRKTLPVNHRQGIISIPSSHHVYYAPSGTYLLVVDPNQSVVFTYQVDATGLPTSQVPSAHFPCSTDAPSLGWFSKAFAKVVGISGPRPRRVAVSPNAAYVFVSYETRNVVQVYRIDERGTIDPDGRGCLQQVSTVGQELRHQNVIGGTVQLSAELAVFRESLYVSNRAMKWIAGKGENSIRVFDIRDGGRLATQHAVHCSGPVRHLTVYEDGGDEVLVAGTCKPSCSLQTFRRKTGSGAIFELVGEAEVDVDVYCVVPGK